ncbi:GntR family transcriptional regulator [Streptomyces sp. NPDC005407]|uniref:GntR family transcriptional regulator n=1 Tax=Streptomyces sp. NPDC005407 TaxID=3155340 RepID=UPI0033A890F2
MRCGESQLAERYEVSGPTVRRAINVLVGEGLLYVAHGRGTFVRARPERRVILVNGEDVADLLAEDHDPSEQGWLRGEHAEAETLRRSGVDAREAVITKGSTDNPDTSLQSEMAPGGVSAALSHSVACPTGPSYRPLS